MVKKIMQWSPLVKWMMGVVAVILCGYIAFISDGAVKARANFDTIPKVQKKLDSTAKKIENVKEQTSKDVSDIKERIARIEANTETILRAIEKMDK